jgi:hypothetical protein
MRPEFPTFINPDITMPSLTVLPPTNRLYEYLFPLFIILSSLTALPATLWNVLKTRPRDIFFPSRWLDEWFARIWSNFTAMPFIEEKRRIAAEASGVVIELGPGFGDSLEHYDKATVGHVYLIEPNLDMHEGLRKNVEKFGWEGKATIVGCGIEDTEGLKKAGVPEEGVDTVVAIQVCFFDRLEIRTLMGDRCFVPFLCPKRCCQRFTRG